MPGASFEQIPGYRQVPHAPARNVANFSGPAVGSVDLAASLARRRKKRMENLENTEQRARCELRIGPGGSVAVRTVIPAVLGATEAAGSRNTKNSVKPYGYCVSHGQTQSLPCGDPVCGRPESTVVFQAHIFGFPVYLWRQASAVRWPFQRWCKARGGSCWSEAWSDETGEVRRIQLFIDGVEGGPPSFWVAGKSPGTEWICGANPSGRINGSVPRRALSDVAGQDEARRSSALLA